MFIFAEVIYLMDCSDIHIENQNHYTDLFNYKYSFLHWSFNIFQKFMVDEDIIMKKLTRLFRFLQNFTTIGK